MVTWFEKLDSIHPYPAKYPLSLATRYIEQYSNGGTVYDPFMGSGTTLLAASMNGNYSVGTDINGIAELLSSFKMTPYTKEDFHKLQTFCDALALPNNVDQIDLVDYQGIDHWFQYESKLGLSFLKTEIKRYFSEEPRLQLFCMVALSGIINIVSNQESDTRYAAKPLLDITATKVIQIFKKKLLNNIRIVKNTSRDPMVLRNSHAFLHNAKTATEVIKSDSISLLMTSPPYPNTYDYYLYHKHRMLWLDYDFNYSKNEEIGSRNEFSSRKQPSSNFSNDLFEIFSESNKLLKSGAHIVIVIGDGVIRGEFYDSREHTIDLCKEIGWNLVDSEDTELDKTSRSFNKGFRTSGKKEHILIFDKC